MIDTILKQTDKKEHPEVHASLKSAFNRMNELLSYINEKTREMETDNKVSKLIANLEGNFNVKEVLGKSFYGELQCKSSLKLEVTDMKVFLFEDLLLLTKIKKRDKLALILKIPFSELILIDVADNPRIHLIFLNRFVLRRLINEFFPLSQQRTSTL